MGKFLRFVVQSARVLWIYAAVLFVLEPAIVLDAVKETTFGAILDIRAIADVADIGFWGMHLTAGIWVFVFLSICRPRTPARNLSLAAIVSILDLIGSHKLILLLLLQAALVTAVSLSIIKSFVYPTWHRKYA